MHSRHLLALLVMMMGASAHIAEAGTSTIGMPDFVDSQFPGLELFHHESFFEPAPFGDFNGSDGVANFSAQWTHSYPTEHVVSAELMIGLFDHDSAATGEQVAAFSVNGIDLTALLNGILESRGGNDGQYNIYTISLPEETYDSLGNGSATFSLHLQAFGSAGNEGAQNRLPAFNGAGIDFSTLSITTPEPGGCVIAGMLMLAIASRRVRILIAD